jgi:hypothetical protein
VIFSELKIDIRTRVGKRLFYMRQNFKTQQIGAKIKNARTAITLRHRHGLHRGLVVSFGSKPADQSEHARQQPDPAATE